MKLKLLACSLVAALAFKAGATTLNINVQDFSFTPSDATIQLGDTIKFTWVNGSHTTTSTTIPAGAAAWDNPMNAANTTFIYVPAVAGVYSYKCTPHAAMGHVGKFTVTGTTGISNYDFSKTIFDLYPNPARGVLNIALTGVNKPGRIAIADISGKQVLTVDEMTSDNIQVDISTLNQGLYFVRLEQDGKTYVRKFTVTR
jgi:plastocyanin